MASNICYNASLFVTLFSNPGCLLDLYGAIKGVVIPKETRIEINTLSDVLYLNRINDISFRIGKAIVVLMEHQSTINPNMPLRFLVYIARVYEKIVDNTGLYSRGLVKIPTPEFIVLYNGREPCADYVELRLSDAFKDAGLEPPPLELVVKMYNITKGHNAEIAERCRILREYAEFINAVRENERKYGKGSLEKAMGEAVHWCIENDVLRDFLKEHGSEVHNMLLSEFTVEDAVKLARKEGRKKGREEGRKKGREEGWTEGRTEGITEGLVQGKAQGFFESAQRMKAYGMEAKDIVICTGLTLDEIAGL